MTDRSHQVVAQIRVDRAAVIGEVHPHIFGHFIEHLDDCIYNGLWAELLQNRKFTGHDTTYYGLVNGWKPIGAEPPRVHRASFKADQGTFGAEPVWYSHDNSHYYVPGYGGRGQSQRIDIRRASGDARGIGQDGLALRDDWQYTGYAILSSQGIDKVEVSLAGEVIELDGIDSEWRLYPFTFVPGSSHEDALFSLTTREQGTLWIAAVSLMPADNEAGWRRDVLELVRGLKPPILRYPGGNFASNYHWRDGIGERDHRPTRSDPVWYVYEPNDVGTDEFMTLCRLLDTEPYLCVNMGNGTPEEAAAWVAYCNGPVTTEYGAMRAANGHPEPYNVIYWGLGNESYGNWQVGHVDAETFARECVIWAEAMRAADPDGQRLKLLAVGATPDFWPDWNSAVARIAGAHIDYITLHHYAQADEDMPSDDEYALTVSAPSRINVLISASRAAIDANAPAGKKIAIAFDEWNVIHQRTSFRLPAFNAEWYAHERHSLFTGVVAQLETVAQLRVERQQYALADALYAAGFFNVLLREADHVLMANQAQLVNLLGLIETSQTSAYPTGEYRAFSLYVSHSGPIALHVQVEGPTFDVRAMSSMPARPEEPYLDVVATCTSDGHRIWLHVVNRHPHLAISAQIDLGGASVAETTMHLLHGRGPWSRNTPENHEVVSIRHDQMAWDGTSQISFPACSACSLEIVLA